MKNSMLFAVALGVCLLLPSCCGRKCSDKKTTKTVEQEIEAQAANIRKLSVKEPAELPAADIEEATVIELEIDANDAEIAEITELK